MPTSTSDQIELMTVAEARAVMKVSKWTIYRLIWDRKIESVHVGRCHRIVRESLNAYIQELLEEVN